MQKDLKTREKKRKTLKLEKFQRFQVNHDMHSTKDEKELIKRIKAANEKWM
jgi:hypothetical protein